MGVALHGKKSCLTAETLRHRLGEDTGAGTVFDDTAERVPVEPVGHEAGKGFGTRGDRAYLSGVAKERFEELGLVGHQVFVLASDTSRFILTSWPIVSHPEKAVVSW